MLTNILVPALGLILLTFVIGLIHTIASVNLMGKGKDWEESGIPVEPYKAVSYTHLRAHETR